MAAAVVGLAVVLVVVGAAVVVDVDVARVVDGVAEDAGDRVVDGVAEARVVDGVAEARVVDGVAEDAEAPVVDGRDEVIDLVEPGADDGDGRLPGPALVGGVASVEGLPSDPLAGRPVVVALPRAAAWAAAPSVAVDSDTSPRLCHTTVTAANVLNIHTTARTGFDPMRKVWPGCGGAGAKGSLNASEVFCPVLAPNRRRR